jgi:TusA-related sulfurtransferase
METYGTIPSLETIRAAEVSVATSFVEALSERDFDAIERLFAPEVRFRAVVPRGIREAATGHDATGWLRKWFGDAESIELLGSEAGTLADRTYIRYRFRVVEDGRTTMIEQHCFASLAGGLISDFSLLCSGFRPVEAASADDPADGLPAAAPAGRIHDYDAGDLGCGDGLPGEFRRRLAAIPVGDVLRVQTRDPAARADLPALARMLGHRVGTVAEAPEGGLLIDVERVK